MKKQDIPNAICWFRIALIVPVLLFLIPSSLTEQMPIASIVTSCALFAVAMISDSIDGKIARKYNFVSDLGKFLDPIADKMLVLSVLVAFAVRGNVSAFSVIAIMLREILVTGLRLPAASSGIVIPANIWGKIKTILQGISIFITYLCLILKAYTNAEALSVLPEVLFAAVAVFTWISAVPYIKACAPYLKG